MGKFLALHQPDVPVLSTTSGQQEKGPKIKIHSILVPLCQLP